MKKKTGRSAQFSLIPTLRRRRGGRNENRKRDTLMRNANEYGFLPGNDAAENSRILQSLLDLGGEISVEQAGVYDLSETVEIGDNTTLRFQSGASIRRQASKTGRTGMLMVNRGCDRTQYNRGIKLIGLHIDCNGIESDAIGRTAALWE